MRGGRLIQRDIDQTARIHLDHHAIQIPICGIHGIRRCSSLPPDVLPQALPSNDVIRSSGFALTFIWLRRFDQPPQLLDGRQHLVAIDTDLA